MALCGWHPGEYIDEEISERVFQLARIWPSQEADIVFSDPIVELALETVLIRSGMLDQDYVAEQIAAARDSKTIYHLINAYISEANNSLMVEELDKLPLARLIDLYVIAEDMIAIRQTVINQALAGADPVVLSVLNASDAQPELDPKTALENELLGKAEAFANQQQQIDNMYQ